MEAQKFTVTKVLKSQEQEQNGKFSDEGEVNSTR